MTALPGLDPPGLYLSPVGVTWVDRDGGWWVWAGDPIGTPGTRWGFRPLDQGDTDE